MKNLIIWLNRIITKHKALKRWKRIMTVLAAIMTFVTTYALILPAITVERNKVEDVGGMYLEQEADTNDMLEENALEPIGVSIAADHENAVTFAYADDSMTATAVFGTDEEIPAGAELVVTPVDPESEEYISLSSRSAELLDKEFIYDVTTCSFYDFALVCNNIDVTPKTGLVDIQIIFHDNTVEHFDDTLFAGRFARPTYDANGFAVMAADNTDAVGAADTLAAVDTDATTDTLAADNSQEVSVNLSDVKDELVSVNPDESSVIELTDGIITVLSLKGNDLSENESLVGILAGNVDEEIKAAAAETDAEIPDYDDAQEENAQADSAGTDGDEAAPAVTTLKATGTDYTVTLTCDASSGIPEGAALTVSEIAQDSEIYQNYLKETKKAMGLTEEETLPRYAARFFDIKIMVGEDEFIPESGVSVEITYAEPLAEKAEAEVSAVHFAAEAAEAEVIEANTTKIQDGGAATVEFTAESFSVYGVIYTVDFHWEVNGKIYEFSIPGGGFVSLEKLVEALGIYSQDISSENSNLNSSVEYTKASLNLNDVVVSDAAREFVANVANVEFSNPELVDVSRVETDITVEQIKESRELECQYSEELTEEEIAEINNSTVVAGDWALISLRSFVTDEMLTVTMKDGEEFTLKVTDAQINNTSGIVPGNNYYIYTVSDGVAYALAYDGSTSVVDVNNPTLGDDYNWVFAKPDDYWIIRNVGHDDHYLDLKGGNISTTSATGIRITDRTDSNAGLSMMNWERGSWVYLTLNKRTDPYTFATSSSGSRMRLLDAPAAQPDDPGDEPEETPTSQIPNTIDPPTGTKTLVPNVSEGQADGTYTLSLSVTPHSNPEGGEKSKKANVLVVMDRSSSMITKIVSDDDRLWYYGDTATATFRGDIRSGTGYTFYTPAGTRLYENQYWARGGWDNYSLHLYNSDGPQYTGDVWVRSDTTRLYAEQDALSNSVDGLFKTLLDNNEDSGYYEDIVEIKVISFGDQRFDERGYSDETDTADWVKGRDSSALDTAVSSSRFTSGTNWEEALQYAWDEISEKKALDGNKEEYYVVFLTDGEPTAVYGNEENAAPYTNGDNTTNGNIVAYDAAKDEAQKLVNNGIKFYNIFTFRKDEKIKYSVYLTNYAYGNGDYNNDDTTDAAKNYFSDAKRVEDLKDIFNDIIQSVNTAVGHNNVVITDMLTTDALTSTTVEGRAEGFMYTVQDKNGIVLYTVTAKDNEEDPTKPIVTFHVPNPETGGTDDYPAEEDTENGKTYYYAEIDEDTTYKMALANFTETDGAKSGKIEWDLSSLGMLLGSYTYTVSFIVWPDQDAYDYVAALNNEIPTITNSLGETVTVEWNEATQQPVYEADGTTIKYYKNGVPNYPSIVKYPNKTYAVLTNTEQKVKYTVVKTETINGEPQEPVVSDPIEFELPTPEPMPLTSTGSKISKVWQVNRDPEILLRLLYEFNVDGTIARDIDGNPIPKAVFAYDEEGNQVFDDEDNPVKLADGFFVDFFVQQDGKDYKTVRLGWDDEKKEYVWYEPDETNPSEVDKYTKTITYGEGGRCHHYQDWYKMGE